MRVVGGGSQELLFIPQLVCPNPPPPKILITEEDAAARRAKLLEGYWGMLISLKQFLLIGAVLMAISTPAAAIVFGGSNLDIFGYPSHDCTAPWSKPIKPYSFSDQWEVDQYNMEVDRYNNQISQYVSCIEDYVDNAKNDIERIKEKANEAIREANSQ